MLKPKNNGQTDESAKAIAEKKLWSKEQVAKYCEADINAAIGFLRVLQSHPEIMDGLVDLIYQDIQNYEVPKPVE